MIAVRIRLWPAVKCQSNLLRAFDDSILAKTFNAKWFQVMSGRYFDQEKKIIDK